MHAARPYDSAAAAHEGVAITRELPAEDAFPASRQGFARRIAAAEYLPAAEAVTDPYFRYVQDDIRLGDY
ncbi:MULTISPECIES: hypothetical protein [Streptomyces]|uniref:Uncharacterized protein n=1 Tax=Streptomyces viridochromogenes TaxID=1938 RepID=A0A0L8KDE3_STRVR|nr:MULTISPECIES: hypothetical protein [Streptomyces]KOG23915.1 hypothetical protein ADK34_19410 [Streptomyces viridochromogenes]